MASRCWICEVNWQCGPGCRGLAPTGTPAAAAVHESGWQQFAGGWVYAELFKDELARPSRPVCGERNPSELAVAYRIAVHNPGLSITHPSWRL